MLAVELILLSPARVSAPPQYYLEEDSLALIQENSVMATANPFNWSEALQVLGIITAYSKDETCPDKDCITASGKLADYDIIACPRGIPLGTFVEIDNRLYVCGDRTHLKYDGIFDVWMGENYEKAIEWGKQIKVIKIYY